MAIVKHSDGVERQFKESRVHIPNRNPTPRLIRAHFVNSNAGGGIRTHEPLRDGISRDMPLKSHASNAQGIFDQALRPPQVYGPIVSSKAFRTPIAVALEMSVTYRTDCLHPTYDLAAASDVSRVEREFVMASAVRVRVAVKPKSQFAC